MLKDLLSHLGKQEILLCQSTVEKKKEHYDPYDIENVHVFYTCDNNYSRRDIHYFIPITSY